MQVAIEQIHVFRIHHLVFFSIQSKDKNKKMRLAHKISTQSSERNCLIEPVAKVIKRKTDRDILMRSIHDEMLDLGSFIYIMFPFEIL